MMQLRRSGPKDKQAPIATVKAETDKRPGSGPDMEHEGFAAGTGHQPLTVAVASPDPKLIQHLAAAAAPHAELRWLGALDLHVAPRPEHPAAQARILIVDQALLTQPRSPLVDPQSFADAPAVKVVLVADPHDPTLADRLLAVRASGCLPPRVDSATLLKALQAVDDGDLWFPRHIFNSLYARMLARSAAVPPAALAADAPVPISPRALAVLELAAEGLTNKEIAQRLGISPSTVKKHLHSAMEKRGLRRRRQLLG